MKTELKTLKDIPMEQDKVYSEEDINNDEINKDFRVAFNWKRAIKAEAVKWVKEIDTSTGGEKFVDDPYCCKPCLLDWIKHFFNLTEEDLKEKN